MRDRPLPLQRGQQISRSATLTEASGSRGLTLRSRSITVPQLSQPMISQGCFAVIAASDPCHNHTARSADSRALSGARWRVRATLSLPLTFHPRYVVANFVVSCTWPIPLPPTLCQLPPSERLREPRGSSLSRSTLWIFEAFRWPPTECPLSGVKRTCLFALQMSASDPKRTLLSPLLVCWFCTVRCLGSGSLAEELPDENYRHTAKGLAVVAALAFALIPTGGLAEDNPVVGTWRLKSFVREIVGTGERYNQLGGTSARLPRLFE